MAVAKLNKVFIIKTLCSQNPSYSGSSFKLSGNITVQLTACLTGLESAV
jgi:hypothetical protein